MWFSLCAFTMRWCVCVVVKENHRDEMRQQERKIYRKEDNERMLMDKMQGVIGVRVFECVCVSIQSWR